MAGKIANIAKIKTRKNFVPHARSNKEVPLPARKGVNIAELGVISWRLQWCHIRHSDRVPYSRNPELANSRLSIRHFWGKRGKREAKKGESELRETPLLSLLTLLHPRLKSSFP